MAGLPMYAVIMAGGQGTRFWPASRRQRPKQFLSILGARTMLQETVARIAPLCPAERTLVVTGREHDRLVRRQAPQVPRGNVFAEPVGRSTAPCIALAAEVILGREDDAIMLVLPSDHAIAAPATFRKALKQAAKIAADGWLVTIGVRPTHAETGFGYIETGGLMTEGPPATYRATAFHEKPSAERAEEYVASGRFLWNAGIFVWRASAIRAALERHLPATVAAFSSVRRCSSAAEIKRAMERAYRKVESISIDHGVMEAAERVAVVAGDFGWNDVGSWSALKDVWGSDAQGNSVRGDVVILDAKSNVVLGDKRLVALLGVDDLIVVDTEDALLVCPRARAQDVRRIVDELKRRKRASLL